MTSAPPGRCAHLLALLAACSPDPPAADTSASATSDPTTGSTTADESPTTGSPIPTEPTSTGESATTGTTAPPKPAVCGDGVLDDGELCDDGDLDPDDSCSPECQPLADIEWTVTHNGAADDTDVAVGVTVDKTGNIFVVGAETASNRDALILALGPDGEQLWRKTYDGLAKRNDYFLDVTLDDTGRIYVAGYEEVALDERTAIVRAFEPDGAPLWRFAEEPADPGYATTEGVALADGALYSVGAESLMHGDAQVVVRRHDLGTGAATWRTDTQAGWPSALGEGITASADRIVVVGYVQEFTEIRPLTVELDPAGAITSTIVQELPWGFWYDVVPIGDLGDLMLVGRTFMPGVLDRDVIVRRVAADFTELWTQIYEHEVLEDMGNGVAVGANEAVFVAGSVTPAASPEGTYDILGARYTGAGALLWTDVHDDPAAHLDDYGNAAAAGPGFFVLAGYTTTPDGIDVWVRRYNDG